ncbi:MAG: hypothetical protein P4L83_14065 [Nevskia sp.]|nr:hypothetical protein [Nevskia sp.]
MSDARLFIAGSVSALLLGCSADSNNMAAPVVQFSVPGAASAINLGQSVNLAWSSTNATSCTALASGAGAGPFSGMQAVNGHASVAPTATGNVSYTLTCTGPGGTGMATTPTVTVNPPILSTLATIATIGSTADPIEQGGNPYGLVIAPVSAGLITAGDLVICNFNDGATNTQGQGTTIVGLHPAAGSSPYRIAQSAGLLGCSALGILPDDSIAAAAYSANQDPLVTSGGTVNTPFSADNLQGPWGQIYVPAASGRAAALYVSQVYRGAIDRISLGGDSQAAFTEIAYGFCTSGAPGALYAPAGLTYDPNVDTLYVVDTSSNSVVAFAGVSTIGSDGVVVNGNCGANTPPTPAPTFSGPSAAAARVIANGGQLNGPISAALLSDGDLVVANADLNSPPQVNLLFEISPALGFVGQPVQLDNGAPGALFGLVATTDAHGNTIIYFNDDNNNAVMSLSR